VADIFISYSRPDRARIEKLAAALEAAGYSVWWDMNLSGGAQFSKETAKHLNEARAVVVCWSKTSIDSMWVADEATVGRTKGNLVPIAIDAVDPPLGFGQIHAISFAGWGGAVGEAQFIQLDKSLAALLARAPSTTAPSKPTFAGRIRKLAHARPRAVAAIAAAAATIVAITILNIAPFRGGGPALSEDAIAVLPFANTGGDANDDYLSEGLADELRDQLGRVPGLRVKARASSNAVRDENLDTKEIGERLGAGRLIEGSVLKHGSQLRVSVRIVESKSGDQIWSKTYDRTANDLLNIQQEIAAAVVAEIAASESAPPPSTTDISAYDKLLLARHYEQEVKDAQIVDEAKLARAIDLYKAAVADDPASAVAHARLAGALLYAGDADAAEPEVFRALNLDPNSSDVQFTLATFYAARNLPGIEAAYTRAVGINPNNVDALDGLAHLNWGFKFEPIHVSEELFRRALSLDPLSLRRYSTLGYFYGVIGQRMKALDVVREIAEQFPDAAGSSAIAQIAEQTGDFDIAITAAKQALSIEPGNRDIKGQLAELYAEIGDFDAASRYEKEPGLGQLFWRRDYARLVDLGEEIAIDQPEDVQVWYLLAFGYAALGADENAVRALDIAGLPELANAEMRNGGDQAAMATLAGALDGVGRTDDARATARSLADQMRSFLKTGADQGAWANTHLACALAVLGEDDAAMTAFSRVNDGSALPRLPWLKDYQCFNRFHADERYKRVIAAVEMRQATLRAQIQNLE